VEEARVGTGTPARPVERSSTRISSILCPGSHQLGKPRASKTSLLHCHPHICYKQFTESSSVASRA